MEKKIKDKNSLLHVSIICFAYHSLSFRLFSHHICPPKKTFTELQRQPSIREERRRCSHTTNISTDLLLCLVTEELGRPFNWRVLMGAKSPSKTIKGARRRLLIRAECSVRGAKTRCNRRANYQSEKKTK